MNLYSSGQVVQLLGLLHDLVQRRGEVHEVRRLGKGPVFVHRRPENRALEALGFRRERLSPAVVQRMDVPVDLLGQREVLRLDLLADVEDARAEALGLLAGAEVVWPSPLRRFGWGQLVVRPAGGGKVRQAPKA